MGRWMQKFGSPTAVPNQLLTDNTARGISDSTLSVTSVLHIGVSENLNREIINQKVTIPSTDKTDADNQNRLLSVMSVIDKGSFLQNQGIIKYSETPIALTDKADSSQSQTLSKFCDLVRHVGASNGKLLDNTEILRELDVEGIRELNVVPREVRLAWATAVALRLIRKHSLIPNGWDLVAHCANCGPVWSYAAFECLSCPWCEIRHAGKWIPRPDI
jgi:hypothetical protein